MNKYITKIAADFATEFRAGKAAGKAILADKVGDAAGLATGAYIGSKVDPEHKQRDALIGAGIVGSGLTYASIRRDILRGVKK